MRRVGWLACAVVACVVTFSGSSGPQAIAPRAALERLFVAERLSAEWFAPALLAEAPLARIEQIVAGLKRAHGAFQRVEEDGPDFLVVLERAVVPTRMALDAGGRIAGLFFLPARPRVAGLQDAVRALQALPGRTSLLVLEDGRDRAAVNADAPLAVGSAFKLTVLGVLRAEIASGRRTWRDVVELRPEWKSLPSGLLQDWPDGSPLSLTTLAGLMISRSDNTAADALIAILGRAAVEAAAPPRNRPFLTTRELFGLKTPRNQDLLARYRAGAEGERRAVLEELQRRPAPTAAEVDAVFAKGPGALDVEWFYTTRELCAAIARVADLELMGINPGPASRRDWTRIAYKGGSEPGVLNLTAALQGRNQRAYCVAATWNNDAAALDEQRLVGLYGTILDLLK